MFVTVLFPKKCYKVLYILLGALKSGSLSMHRLLYVPSLTGRFDQAWLHVNEVLTASKSTSQVLQYVIRRM